MMWAGYGWFPEPTWHRSIPSDRLFLIRVYRSMRILVPLDVTEYRLLEGEQLNEDFGASIIFCRASTRWALGLIGSPGKSWVVPAMPARLVFTCTGILGGRHILSCDGW